MPQTTDPYATLDATKLASIEPPIAELLARPVPNASALERWILDRSFLAAALGEGRARLYIAMTCNTDDASAQQAYTTYIEQVAPRLTELAFELDRRLVELERATPLDKARYGVLVRNARADVELFRPENVPLETELATLGQRYDQISGAMAVTFQGQERTLPQMMRFQEQNDRATREAAWRTVTTRRLQDADAIDTIYDAMIGLRTRVARNAGFENFVGYAFKSRRRFDYGVGECERFHEGVEKAIVPIMRAIDAKRATQMGLPALRPWDMSVDPLGRPPLSPFEGGRALVDKTRAMFDQMDPQLAAMFRSMGPGDQRVRHAGEVGEVCLDLDSRKGKAPGGYQYMLDRVNKPFIFMNAAGTQKDVVTMVHEAGHAFHSMLCEHEPLVEYRHATEEICEVASMAMELLTMPHWGTLYSAPADLARARADQLKRAIVLLPWIATIDAFQLWIYRHPTHTRAERTRAWLDLDQRFGSRLDWSGLDDARAKLWHKQMHLFGAPFYYIEYGIAQLGALRLWLHALEHGADSALARYKRALALGGSRPLPELFAAAGLEFDFGPQTLQGLAARVMTELQRVEP